MFCYVDGSRSQPSALALSLFVIVLGFLIGAPKVWSANGVGLVLGISYFFEFTRHSPKESSTLPGSVVQHMQGASLVFGIALVTTLTFSTETAAAIIGALGVVFNAAMFASPLAAVKHVLETKNAKSIPLPFTMASLVNCFLWSVLGLFGMHDFNIYAPNLMGLTFALIQVALRIVYMEPRSERQSVEASLT